MRPYFVCAALLHSVPSKIARSGRNSKCEREEWLQLRDRIACKLWRRTFCFDWFQVKLHKKPRSNMKCLKCVQRVAFAHATNTYTRNVKCEWRKVQKINVTKKMDWIVFDYLIVRSFIWILFRMQMNGVYATLYTCSRNRRYVSVYAHNNNYFSCNYFVFCAKRTMYVRASERVCSARTYYLPIAVWLYTY